MQARQGFKSCPHQRGTLSTCQSFAKAQCLDPRSGPDTYQDPPSCSKEMMQPVREERDVRLYRNPDLKEKIVPGLILQFPNSAHHLTKLLFIAYYI